MIGKKLFKCSKFFLHLFRNLMDSNNNINEDLNVKSIEIVEKEDS